MGYLLQVVCMTAFTKAAILIDLKNYGCEVGDQTLLYSESAWESTEKEPPHSENPRAHLEIEEGIGGTKREWCELHPFWARNRVSTPFPPLPVGR